MSAVVLRGPADSAPESIVGPFPTMAEADAWAVAHPRAGGYCLAQALSPPGSDEFD